MAGQEEHPNVALEHVALQPLEPVDDGASRRVLLGEQAHVDIAVELAFLLLQVPLSCRAHPAQPRSNP